MPTSADYGTLSSSPPHFACQWDMPGLPISAPATPHWAILLPVTVSSAFRANLLSLNVPEYHLGPSLQVKRPTKQGSQTPNPNTSEARMARSQSLEHSVLMALEQKPWFFFGAGSPWCWERPGRWLVYRTSPRARVLSWVC